MAYCQSSSTALSKCHGWLIELLEKGTKTIQCIDCGIEVEVNNKTNKKCRCDNCQRIYRKMYDKLRKR